MITWIESISEWDRSLPAVLVAIGVTAEQRRPLLHALVARATSVDVGAVVVEQAEGKPPAVAKPIGSGLHLSFGSRGPCMAAAVARSRVGVDVELVDEASEIPWNVLHEAEAALLRTLKGEARATAFARVWSLKEAYLKALGTGLFREPSSFAVSFRGEAGAIIDDDSAAAQVAEARTTWYLAGRARAAISAIILKSAV
jgi:phosphopantetheinyl transferase